MSSRRTRAPTNREDELRDLVMKLQGLLPDSRPGCSTMVSASKILKETCDYIKHLQKEVDNLGERLSQLLDSMENNGVDIDILRDLLQQ